MKNVHSTQTHTVYQIVRHTKERVCVCVLHYIAFGLFYPDSHQRPKRHTIISNRIVYKVKTEPLIFPSAFRVVCQFLVFFALVSHLFVCLIFIWQKEFDKWDDVVVRCGNVEGCTSRKRAANIFNVITLPENHQTNSQCCFFFHCDAIHFKWTKFFLLSPRHSETKTMP